MASSWDSILLLVLFVSAIFRSLGYDSPEAAQEALNLKENAEGSGADLSKAEWVVNSPKYFERHHHYELSGPKGRLVDMRGNKTNMGAMTKMLEERLLRTDGFTDGEVVDAMEHFFWGQFGGVAMELGSLDGSHNTRSMTRDYEDTMGWHRILVDGNPQYRKSLPSQSPEAFGVVAAICEKVGTVHFSPKEYVGGIIEFMGKAFMKEYHKEVWVKGTPEGDLETVDWNKLSKIKAVPCVPLSHILKASRTKHVNYFILDVEGGELEVLKSINWHAVKFDVLCIETEKENRPPHFEANITNFLKDRGYQKDGPRQGRNTWYTRVGFEKSMKPGIAADCYNGARKGKREDDWYLNRRTPPFTPCPLTREE